MYRLFQIASSLSNRGSSRSAASSTSSIACSQTLRVRASMNNFGVGSSAFRRRAEPPKGGTTNLLVLLLVLVALLPDLLLRLEQPAGVVGPGVLLPLRCQRRPPRRRSRGGRRGFRHVRGHPRGRGRRGP